jgi:hypothetical protein
MDIDKVRAIAGDPKRTRAELEQMQKNAKSKGNVEANEAISAVLLARFPPDANAIDRSRPEVAAAIVEEWFPKPSDRKAILNRLLDSIKVANALAPSAWAVTLAADYCRLNVGPVEVFVAYSGSFFMNFAASNDIAPFNGRGFSAVTYKSMAGPNCLYRGKPVDLAKFPQEVLDGHTSFIENAAMSPSGKPRTGTLYGKSHSEGLVKYARQFIRE